MGTLPTPQTRAEQFLNKIAGGTQETLPTPQTRVEQYLNEIAQNGGGGGGGASAFIATFSFESDELVCDKTIDEIITAYENGDTVIGKYTYEDIPLVWQLSVAVEDSEDKYVEFYTVYAMDEGNPLVGAILGIVDDGADVWIRKVPTEIPSLPSGTNNGDMLVWEDGAWTAQSLADADTSSY